MVDGILTARVGLEENLGLTDRQFFFNTSLIHRFTPRSGLYTSYYSLHRAADYQLEKAIIFVDDSLAVGSSARSFFNTDVLSLGYLYTIIEEEDFFLATYLNLYIMRLRTGVSSPDFRFEEESKLTAPLPDLGLLASLRLSSRLNLNMQLGFFSLNMPDFGGSLTTLSLTLHYKPLPWFALTGGYEEFGVDVFYESGHVDTIVEYTLRGPSFGIKLDF